MVAEYKNNIQKSTVFLYTTNKLLEREMKTKYNCIKKNKLLGTSLRE